MATVETTNKNLAYLQMDNDLVNPVLHRCAEIVAESAAGSYLYDMNGDAYLDFTTGIAVNNIGHCHPKVVAAVQEQVSRLMHTSVTTYHHRYIELARKLVDITPPSLNSVFLANSGAEAVEGAIKMARYVTGRPGIINFSGSFHGRTLLATALTTSKLYYRERYEPFPPSIYTAPYPYEYRSQFRGQPEKCVEDCMKHFEVLFNQFVHPKQVAAILVEPIQGEGGYIVPPDSFLPRLRELADAHGILLITDEVQTGFGRTGKMFAVEYTGIEPDILLMGKAIAGGLPLSAFITRKEISSAWQPARHGTTFGGNPVSCAAALATIEVLQEEKLPERAAALGKQIIDRLRTFAANKPYIGEVRGRGLMIGIEFNDDNGGPNHELAEQVVQRCFEHKLLVLTCGIHGQVVRLIPPLNMSEEECEKGLAVLEQAMTL